MNSLLSSAVKLLQTGSRLGLVLVRRTRRLATRVLDPVLDVLANAIGWDRLDPMGRLGVCVLSLTGLCLIFAPVALGIIGFAGARGAVDSIPDLLKAQAAATNPTPFPSQTP